MMKTGRRMYSDKLFIAANQNIDERDYWLSKLAGDLERVHFPYDFYPGKKERTAEGGPAGERVSFRFSRELFAGSVKLSGGSDLKFHMILAAGLMVLLERYTGHKDIMIGSPILKQDLEMEFVNTVLVSRNRVEKAMTFKQLLPEVRETIVQAAKNQNYPMEVLVDKLGLAVTGSESPLFDVVLLLENIHDASYIDGIYRSMTFIFARTESDVEGVIRYDSRLYRAGTIRGIADHFTRVLGAVLADVDAPLGRVDMLSAGEKKQILTEFNQAPESPDPPEVQGRVLHRVFEKQVKESPHRIALVYGEFQVTYRVLDEQADTLARLLRQKGIRADAAAALWVPPSIEMMVGQLGILKSGAAYLPIALDAPGQRVRFILEDSNVEILVSELSGTSKVSEGIEVVDLSILPAPCPPCPASPASPANLAYIIYTSGTTGQPKGVMVEHRQVTAYLRAFYREFDIGPGDVVIQLAPYSFDVFIEEVYSLLLKGGKVIIPTRDQVLEMRRLSALVSRHQVTVIDCTPLLLNEFNKLDPAKLSSVRLFINGGDILKEEYISNLSGTGTVYNTYGPTETTVCASYYRYKGDHRGTVPIGKPVGGYHVYILDECYSLQPIGAAGEICIAGAGVTRGYLNRPELTAEKFDQDKIEAMTGENKQKLLRGVQGGSFLEKSPPGRRRQKIYKTGDLGRWQPDGNIEFLGRKDLQLKIRGYRIEAGEIEYQLLKREEIKAAVVIPREDKEGEKYLCAYIVPLEAVEKSSFQWAAELRDYLLERVPDYMVPSFFVLLERIPLNFHGKLDRKALPGPEVKGGVEYIPPRSVVEKKLVQIWQGVFGLEKIGVKDDFFDLGGHSLRGIQLANEIHKTFEVDIQFTEIFQRRTVEGLARYIEEAEENRFTAIEPVEEKEYYILSSVQRRLYFLQLMIPGSTAYNIPQAVPIGGSINRQRLEGAFKQLIQRNESLRTSFEMVDREPVQRIHRGVPFKVEYFDSPGAVRFLAFDFSTPPLFRAGLLGAGSNYTLLLDMHHIVTDAVSMGILSVEFLAIYSGQPLPDLKLQYKDYAEWQNSDRQKAAVKKQEQYWLRQFAGGPPVLDLPIDYPRPLVQSFAGGSISFSLGQSEVGGLKEIARESGVTLYMTVLALYNLLLARLSNQEDIIVGTVIAGRNHADLQDIIGMFVNTLAMRNYPHGEKSFAAFLEEVEQNTGAAYENRDYPFEDLVENLPIKRDTGRNPVFGVVFNWMNREEYQSQYRYGLEVPGINNDREISPVNTHQTGLSKFDLTLSAVESGDELVFVIEYCAALFKPETIERFIEYFKKIASAVGENPRVRISGIGILGEEEKNRLLYEFNQTASEYPRGKTIHRLFTEQAEKRPDGAALVGSGEMGQLTYGELNKRSDQAARRLRERGVQNDTIVGTMMGRSLEMIIGILGILKAGGAYLPIDPEYPQERIDYMLKDSGAVLLLCGGDLPDICEGTAYCAPTILPAAGNRHHSLAYVIYTSGTTGRPKGVMVEHGGILNTVYWRKNEYQLGTDDSVLQFFSFSFDGFLTSFFTPVVSGSRVVLLTPEALKGANLIRKIIVSRRVTHFIAVPSLYLALLEECRAGELSGVKMVTLAGEKSSSALIEKSKRLHPGLEVVNEYGVTEGSVASSVSRDVRPGFELTIGKPISNTGIYILNKDRQLVPVGIAGELFLSGRGIARGYLNRPGLTAERFIANPFVRGERMYFTGDLARRHPDGNIEFSGRGDEQVKIRGFRVEPGEIENRLLAVKGIKEAIVIAGDDNTGQKYLCAYIVSAVEIVPQEIKNILSRELPAYMIPAYFVRLDNMPLTPNGKVDRRSLPVPQAVRSDIYAAPGSEAEEKMVEMWSEILGIAKETIGIDDDFFERGGNSLKVTMLAARIHEIFNVDIPLGEIFNVPTIRGICAVVSVTDWVRNPGTADTEEEKEEIVI
jgi:amino acid adenylation domain-containing protein